MECMPNGNLKDYLIIHNDQITKIRRLQWGLEADEGPQLLHSATILHCDVEPKKIPFLTQTLGSRLPDLVVLHSTARKHQHVQELDIYHVG